MKREDALFNWLQIQVVAEARPDDRSALDTAAFFAQLLLEDRVENGWYHLSGKQEAGQVDNRYPGEAVESLLAAIENEPKFNC